MRVLATGAAGLVGFHAARQLLEEGHEVVGLDNLNDDHAVSLEEDRLAHLRETGFRISKQDLCDDGLSELLDHEGVGTVFHLAPQAGGRYSCQHPRAWVDALAQEFGYLPATPIREGIERSIDWYKRYYHVG